ncbi:MAG: DUF4126 domain-containing protein [Acidobacteria bacterium]|nr:DUF4126 domain-containing protein [Acidobacteriota bacterium]
MVDILSAFGLSAATGLNAYLPLLVVGLLARFTDLITLSTPWSALENGWVLALLAALLIVEAAAARMPEVAAVLERIRTLARPAAGAILFAAASHVISGVSPVLAMICGILVAGGVQAARASVRRAPGAGMVRRTAAPGVLETAASGVAALLAVVLPLPMAALALAFLGLWAWRGVRDRRRRA